MNDIADQILIYLLNLHSRVYRNKTGVTTPIFPYIVFRIESAINTMPSEDLYLNIYIYDDPGASVRVIETLADTIDGDGNKANPGGLNQKIINTTGLCLHFNREQRQHVEANDLINAQMINMRYVVRSYFK
jgi:hypothetical protein